MLDLTQSLYDFVFLSPVTTWHLDKINQCMPAMSKFLYAMLEQMAFARHFVE